MEESLLEYLWSQFPGPQDVKVAFLAFAEELLQQNPPVAFDTRTQGLGVMLANGRHLSLYRPAPGKTLPDVSMPVTTAGLNSGRLPRSVNVPVTREQSP